MNSGDDSSSVRWTRPEGASLSAIRIPLRSVGVSARVNVFGFVVLRFDYTKPLNRPGVNPFWTISFGPVF